MHPQSKAPGFTCQSQNNESRFDVYEAFLTGWTLAERDGDNTQSFSSLQDDGGEIKTKE